MRGAAGHKLCGHGGMTLVETLAAIAILALLSSIILIGAQAAVLSARKSSFAAECQTVSDTIDTALSDPLRYATDVTVDGDGNVTAYSNPNYRIADGAVTVGVNQGSAGDLGLIYLASGKLLLNAASYSHLVVVPENFSPGAPYSSNFKLTYNNSTHTFSGGYQLYDPIDKQLSGTYSFLFRDVNSVTAQIAG